MAHDHTSDHATEELGVVMTGVTLVGMLLAAASAYGGISAQLTAFGLTLVYIFGGLPSAARALRSLWVDHVLDIDLLMVVAAAAAAAVGAAMEGAVLLTLFGLSGLIWLFVLLPLQLRQRKLLAQTTQITAQYRRLSRLWQLWGALATLLPLPILYFMITKSAG
jgi:cation transport ATPase